VNKRNIFRTLGFAVVLWGIGIGNSFLRTAIGHDRYVAESLIRPEGCLRFNDTWSQHNLREPRRDLHTEHVVEPW